MAITLNANRQEVISGYVDITYDQVPTTATVYAALKMPVNAIVVGGDLVVTTAWNTATTATVDIGDVTTGNRYANDVDLKTAARTALTLTGFTITSTQPVINFTPTYVGTAATAGAARLTVNYIVKGRGAFSQG
jgi:hypothetical protein